MLKTLRSKTRNVMLATLILVIPSFVLFYGWSNVRDRQVEFSHQFARISPPGSHRFGIPAWKRWVDLDQYDMLDARTHLGFELQAFFGPRLATMLIREYGEQNLFTNQEILQQALNIQLLRNRAEKRNIAVGREALRQAMAAQLRGIPREHWPAVLRSEGHTPDSFARMVRTNETLDRVAVDFETQAKVSLNDLWQEFLYRQQELKIDFAHFDRSDYAGRVAVSQDALREWFSENQEDFRVGEQKRYRYAYFPKSRMPQPEVTEEGLNRFFEANQSNYVRGPQVQIRQIYVPAPLGDEGADAEIEAAQERIIEALAALDAGADFAEVADRFSEDPENVSLDGRTRLGGFVPEWISEDRAWELGQGYVQAALALELGQMSSLTPVFGGKYTGFVIMKAENRREQSVPSLDDIRAEVRGDYERELVGEAFAAKRQELEGLIAPHLSMDEIVTNLEMSEGLTTWTLTESPVIAPELGILSTENKSYIDTLRPGQRSVLLASEDVLFLVEVVNQRPSFIPEFADIADSVETAYREAIGQELAREAADNMLASLRDGGSFRSLADAAAAAQGSTDFFRRHSLPDTVPQPMRNFARDSAHATTGTMGINSVGYNEDDLTGYTLWRVTAVSDPSREDFTQALPVLRRDLIGQRQKAVLDEWLWDQRQALEKSGSLRVNPDFARGMR